MLFALPAASNLFAALGEKPARGLSENGQNTAQSNLSSELKELENERINLVAAVKKANLIALAVGVCVGAAAAYF